MSRMKDAAEVGQASGNSPTPSPRSMVYDASGFFLDQ
jgi:hypothetical protein